MKYYYTGTEQERAVLVGVILGPASKMETESHLEELALLAETAGGKPIKKFTQRLDRPHPATFVGKGMLENIKSYVKEEAADLVIFDDELSPTQLRNIEKVLDCKVLDRTNLILDIFAGRARTAHARLQVELAQYQYLLPRLTRMWTHLERQQGGIGVRGPGETEIETDRRIIRDKIARLKKQLVVIDRQKSTQRANRGKLVRVALVGYTNAGKSTLLNLLSKSDVFAENKLFATLDTTVRKVVIQNLPFLLADTVGFIHKLPHCLVESFKATLDEVREADLLLHVIDSSHPGYEQQMRVVISTLREIGAADKPVITVFNKIDRVKPKEPEHEDHEPEDHVPEDHVPEDHEPEEYEPEEHHDINRLAEEPGSDENGESLLVHRDTTPRVLVSPDLTGNSSIAISAIKKTNIDGLREKLYAMVKDIHVTRYPYNDFLFQIVKK